jgi:hypothetical protein
MIRKELIFPEKFEILLVLALGKPVENVYLKKLRMEL